MVNGWRIKALATPLPAPLQFDCHLIKPTAQQTTPPPQHTNIGNCAIFKMPIERQPWQWCCCCQHLSIIFCQQVSASRREAVALWLSPLRLILRMIFIGTHSPRFYFNWCKNWWVLGDFHTRTENNITTSGRMTPILTWVHEYYPGTGYSDKNSFTIFSQLMIVHTIFSHLCFRYWHMLQ